MSGLFSSAGKQVLVNERHYADAADEKAAAFIAAACTDHARYARLHKAASAYFHAASNRTAGLAAGELRDALANAPVSA